MINFVYLSPHFPATNINFCEHLAEAGVRVLGIGDAPAHQLPTRLVNSLTEYYRVDSLADYDQVYRAVAYLGFRYGRIDWVESNNEHWLEQDARLRTDFNVRSGRQLDRINQIKSKVAMHAVYQDAQIPTARQIRLADVSAARDFCAEVGFPVVVKPEHGVGAINTWKLRDELMLERFFTESVRDGLVDGAPYVMEEFVKGRIISYDGIVGDGSAPVFEAAVDWGGSIMNVVNDDLDLSYRVLDVVPPELAEIGRRTLQAFGVRNRFFHLEFFRLSRDHAGLGSKGDYVALEANMRPAGGCTTDMYNYATSSDVYQIYADLVTGRDSGAAARAYLDPQFCVYAGRRFHHCYRLSREELWRRYGSGIVRAERNPAMMVPQMGDEFFMLRTPDEGIAQGFAFEALDRHE